MKNETKLPDSMPTLTSEEIELWKEIASRSSVVVSYITANEEADEELVRETQMQAAIAMSNEQKRYIEQAVKKIERRKFYMLGEGLSKSG
ncbi:TPA: hypothetical protein ACGTRQ_005056 [Vibrio parahaemolyticus]